MTAVFWWAGYEEGEPWLVVGFSGYRNSPRRAVNVLGDALDAAGKEAPNFLYVTPVPDDDPRVLALRGHRWEREELNDPDLTYRMVRLFPRGGGEGQAMVYSLRDGGETLVPLPPVAEQVVTGA